jgi:hypothetical protein
MNSEFFCPIRGCPHSTDGDKAPFLTRTTLIRHLHTPIHSSTHHLVNHTRCANAGIYTCCTSSCPSSPKIFFSSLHALHDHCVTIHPPPSPSSTCPHQTPLHLLRNLISSPPLSFPRTHNKPLGSWTSFYLVSLRPRTPRLPNNMAPLNPITQQILLHQPTNCNHTSHCHSQYQLLLHRRHRTLLVAPPPP